MYFENFENP